MKITSFQMLKKYINKSINNALENESFDVIKQTEIKHICDDVFDVYSPGVYVRREFDGIDDPKNITHKPVENGILEVENVAEFNPEYGTENYGIGLVKLIEYGHATSGYFYDYPSSKDFTDPRPFVANTKKEIKRTKSHVKAMKLGLKRNKIETK